MPSFGDAAEGKDLDDAGRFTFEILAHLSLAHVLFAFYEAGVWDRFEEDSGFVLDPGRFADERGLNAKLLLRLAEYLSLKQVLARTDHDGRLGFGLGAVGRKLVEGERIPHFVFFVGGYGRVLCETGRLVEGRSLYGRDIRRDGHYVALGSELVGKTPHTRSYDVVLDRGAEASPNVVVDLGCGSAKFLIRLVEATGATKGLGIDIDGDACALARRRIEEVGLSSRIEVIQGDVSEVCEAEPSLARSIDVVTAMFLVHEFFAAGEKEASRRLAGLSRLLRPSSGRLLILDKCTDALESDEPPPYLPEFTLVHDLTAQVLHPRRVWQRILDGAGLRVVHEEWLPPHTGAVLLECALA
jgi:SAM-dependent methyltransferase